MISTKGKSLSECVAEGFEAIVKQGGRCRANDVCRYGDGVGNHCIAGQYLDPNWSGMLSCDLSIFAIAADEELSSKACGENKQWIKDNVKLLQYMQRIHDAPNLNNHIGGVVLGLKRVFPDVVDARVSKALQAWVDLRIKQTETTRS